MGLLEELSSRLMCLEIWGLFFFFLNGVFWFWLTWYRKGFWGKKKKKLFGALWGCLIVRGHAGQLRVYVPIDTCCREWGECLSDLSLLCSLSLLQAQAEVAQLPELPPAQPQLGVSADQLPVRGTDEPAAEVLTPQVNSSAGEVHTFQQARFQLVRAQCQV